MRKYYNQFQQLDAEIYALSVDSLRQSIAISREMKLPFELLCDETKEVIHSYHLLNPHEHGGIARTAIFIIKENGIIGFRSLDRSLNRVQMNGAVNYFEQLSKEPDFLSQPTMHNTDPCNTPPLTMGILLQIGRNMLVRGNWADWKHYLSVPWRIIKSIFRKTIKPRAS